jgi:hypothetical protein
VFESLEEDAEAEGGKDGVTALQPPDKEERVGAGCGIRGLFVGVGAGSGQCRFCGGVTGWPEDEVGGVGRRALGVVTE